MLKVYHIHGITTLQCSLTLITKKTLPYSVSNKGNKEYKSAPSQRETTENMWNQKGKGNSHKNPIAETTGNPQPRSRKKKKTIGKNRA